MEENGDLLQPRVNTQPATTDTTEPTIPPEGYIPNDKRDKATSRNLAALKNGLNDRILQKVQLNQQPEQPAPVVLSLQKPDVIIRKANRIVSKSYF